MKDCKISSVLKRINICLSPSLLPWFKGFPFYLQAERDRVLREQQLAQEESLARELERRKYEQLKDEKIRQQIRETR